MSWPFTGANSSVSTTDAALFLSAARAQGVKRDSVRAPGSVVPVSELAGELSAPAGSVSRKSGRTAGRSWVSPSQVCSFGFVSPI